VYTMDQPGPVICMYVYVWERCPTHSDPQIHLLWPWQLRARSYHTYYSAWSVRIWRYMRG
jgi:hypothetical protein